MPHDTRTSAADADGRHAAPPSAGLPTRRTFVTSAAAAAVALVASAGSALGGPARPSAPAHPPRRLPLMAGGAHRVVTRRHVADLADGDDNLRMLREAVGVLRRRSRQNPLDPTGWLANGALHSVFCATSDYRTQVHYSWLFLPWHRAYMAALEKQLQTAINEPGLALVYWDWTRAPRMPRHYFGAGADPAATNPLHDVTRESLPTDVIPADFLDVGPALRTPTFRAFGGLPNHDLRQSLVEGILEQGFHNNVHNWIGGNMAGFPAAGLDPIFSAHHGNLDRMWEAWRAADPGNPSRAHPDDRRWLDYAFTFHGPDGRAARVTVAETLSSEALGYRFDTLDFNIPEPGTGGPRAGAPPRHPRAALADAGAAGRRGVMVRFDRAELPAMPLCVRLFFDTPGASVETPPAGDRYGGTFTFLPIGASTKGLDPLVNMQVEASRAVAERVAAGQAPAVRLVPMPLRDRRVPAATVPLRTARVTLNA